MTTQDHLHIAGRDCCRPDCAECAISDAVDQWHEGDRGVRLQEHLGMTRAEYKRWVEGEPAPAHVVERWLAVRRAS